MYCIHAVVLALIFSLSYKAPITLTFFYIKNVSDAVPNLGASGAADAGRHPARPKQPQNLPRGNS
jgi:hypothetical protein